MDINVLDLVLVTFVASVIVGFVGAAIRDGLGTQNR